MSRFGTTRSGTDGPHAIGAAHRLLAPLSLRQSHEPVLNAIRDGVHGGAPDPEIFRRYMRNRARIGHIPTLLTDWITAHAGYRVEARAQVRAWVEENRHLFKRTPR